MSPGDIVYYLGGKKMIFETVVRLTRSKNKCGFEINLRATEFTKGLIGSEGEGLHNGELQCLLLEKLYNIGFVLGGRIRGGLKDAGNECSANRLGFSICICTKKEGFGFSQGICSENANAKKNWIELLICQNGEIFWTLRKK